MSKLKINFCYQKFKYGFSADKNKNDSDIIKFFPNGIFTSVGKYSNSDVELTVEFPPIYLGQPF